MSLPNYLAKIKSSGMYRFTFDKSQIPPAAAETMRLVIGYSDKGPFNNPVYIDNKQDFINLFGNINKRLEKKGVFFHRLALQALSAGPILALNLKPFNNNGGEGGTIEQLKCVSFDAVDVVNAAAIDTKSMDVIKLFDRNRFWKIDADQLPDRIADATISDAKYINIAATDVKDLSCSIFIRNCHPSTVKAYNVSVRDWYKNSNLELPEYLEGHEDEIIADFFAEIYVFRGEFTDALIGDNGALKAYFKNGSLTDEYTNRFGEPADALAALADDPNSNFLGVYRGCLLPYFADANGQYVSLDMLFNADKESHKMIMKLNDAIIDDVLDSTAGHATINDWHAGWSNADINVNTALKPTYIQGYVYNTITRSSSALDIYGKSLDVLNDKGIFEALTNHVDSEYHYIVDTFATIVNRGPVGVGCGPKKNITNIAKAKDNCLAIMNAPAMTDLQKIPSFTMDGFESGDYKGSFSLPSELDGASFAAFYTPLVFGEGTIRTVVPSAALVSNNFMEKWNSRQPYYIVAGPNYGRMDYEGMIGPDYNYSRSDLDVLEPMGINCMVYVPRKGTYINSNQTAKQTPVSALSKVHVRELVIYLQNEIEAMMQNYQWELNTQTLRDTIKTKADALLEKIKANGGVYDYLNVCDGTNNTPEVIDNEMIILDTSIEPARGAGKMVQRLTIHKTGGISSLVK
jgi:hypothetical protein